MSLTSANMKQFLVAIQNILLKIKALMHKFAFLKGFAEVYNSTWRKSSNVEQLLELDELFAKSPKVCFEKDDKFPEVSWRYYHELSRKLLSSAFWRYSVMEEDG